MNSKIEETKNISALMIVEVIGTPPEHLIETLENIIKTIDGEKGVSVKRKEIKEPKLMEGQTDFYTTFAEIEVEVEEILHLAILMFKYMPAHVEILYPELIALTNNGWNDIFNELTRRLHGYDEVARILQLENAQLQKKLSEALGEPSLKKEVSTKTKEKKPVKKRSTKKKL